MPTQKKKIPPGHENNPTLRTLVSGDKEWEDAIAVLNGVEGVLGVKNADLSVLYLVMFNTSVCDIIDRCESMDQLDGLVRSIQGTFENSFRHILENIEEKKKELKNHSTD